MPPKSDVESHAKTVPQTAAMTPVSYPSAVDIEPAPLDEKGFDDRYEMNSVLGVGGMGEVRLYKDKRIGRHVAMKLALRGQGTRSDARMRFEREARVQGQLEHPAIVPVYDMGMGPEGPFFSMRRVRGETLDEILKRLRADDAEARAQYTRRRLLEAFVRVCLAVAFAHARGVLHRDLKPDNVMLGDFGEVYVLDWGLAKLANTADLAAEGAIDEGGSGSAKTAVGAVMGTAGYMAPEQVRGEPADARSDVYALGALLFELLCHQPLHDRGTSAEVFASTMTGTNARPSDRAPAREVPPELDAICVRATALDPADRFAGAREIADAVERFLEGDRDLATRRALADRHAEAAASALAAQGERAESEAQATREAGLRAALAALALDPTHRSARDALVELVLRAPDELPPEARAELAVKRAPADLVARRAMIVLFGSWLVFEPALFFFGTRGPEGFWLLVGLVALTFTMGVASLRARTDHQRLVVQVFVAIGMCLATPLLGPFLVLPQLALTSVLAFTGACPPRHRAIAVGMSVGAIVLPLGLQLAGLLPESYVFKDGGMFVKPWALWLPRGLTLGFLTATTVAALIVPALAIAHERDLRTKLEEREFFSAWSLRKMLPPR